MFERFTDRARRVIVLAQEEARLLNHGYIGTEHLLLGLISEGDGVGAEVLRALEISHEAVRQQVVLIVGRGEGAPSGHVPFTSRAKKALEFSLREGLQLGHDYIGTEHLLLGLIREGEGVAAVVLTSLGADLSLVRGEVIRRTSARSQGAAALTAEEASEFADFKRLFESLKRLLGPIEPGHPDASLTISTAPDVRAILDEVRRLKELDNVHASGARYFIDRDRRLLLRRIGGTDTTWEHGAWEAAGGAILAYMVGAYDVDEVTDAEARRFAPEAFAADPQTPAWNTCGCGRVIIDEPVVLRDFELRIWRARRDREAAIDGQDVETADTLGRSLETLESEKATFEGSWRCECGLPRTIP